MDSWTNLVQSKRELTPSQKFSFLRSALKGSAFKCIEHLPIIDASLEEACEILTQRYGSKLKLRQVFSRYVMECKVLDANAKLGAVRDFHEFVTNSGHLAEKYGFQMSPAIVSDIIIRKYLPPIRRAFFQQCNVSEPTFKQFVELMNETIRREELINPIPVAEVLKPAKERSAITAAMTTKESSQQKAKSTKKGDKPGVKGPPKKKSDVGRTQKYKCVVCTQVPYEVDCPEFKKLTAKEKFEKAKASRLCFSCLKGSGHRAHQCRNKKECGATNADKSVCAKSHHPSIWISQLRHD